MADLYPKDEGDARSLARVCLDLLLTKDRAGCHIKVAEETLSIDTEPR